MLVELELAMTVKNNTCVNLAACHRCGLLHLLHVKTLVKTLLVGAGVTKHHLPLPPPPVVFLDSLPSMIEPS